MNQSLYDLTPIIIHPCEGIDYKIYKDRDYTIIVITTPESRQEIKFRNVGDDNPDASIQFTCEETSRVGDPPKYFSFGIPKFLCQSFIDSLKNKSL